MRGVVIQDHQDQAIQAGKKEHRYNYSMKISNILYALILGTVMFGVPMIHMLQTEQFDILYFTLSFVGFFILGLSSMMYMIAYISRGDFQEEFSIKKRNLSDY